MFDGGVPILKQRTIQARRQRRQFNELGHQALAKKMLMTQLKRHALTQSKPAAQAEASGFAEGFNPGAQAQAKPKAGVKTAPVAVAAATGPSPEADLSDDDESSATETRGRGR